jgi:hypothetical protein
VQPHLARRRAGVAHPVEDFLFTYYSHRPSALRRWHPGFGVGLAGATSYTGFNGYVDRGGVVSVCEDLLVARRPTLTALHTLLAATAERPAQLGCFGMHEWAMVYRQPAAEVRHADWPLRLGSEATDAVVESHRIGCSHFDAYRFFTKAARPLNHLAPGRDDRAAFEQPGCLHAGMDLYGRFAVSLSPLVRSELVADAFELAWDARVLDMQAAPYDLTGLVLGPGNTPWTPVKIETAEGKQEYVRRQRGLAERSQVIRQQLAAECEHLLAVA